MIIAIDGPAGSGKTTVARLLAKKLNIFYLDTGATYRALTLKALEEKIDLSDGFSLKNIADRLSLTIEGEKICLDSRDISLRIRDPVIDKKISLAVAHPAVREIMADLQRKLVKGRSFVVEGRDITTVVFPSAEFKFYLDAQVSVRVERRFKELKEKGRNLNYAETKEDLERRDEADRKRKVGRLTLSPDAVYIDTTNLTAAEAAEVLLKHIESER